MATIIEIQHERLLIEMFNYLLSKGITKEVTEKQYFSIVEKTIRRINNDKEAYALHVTIQDDCFANIVGKVNDICSYENPGISLRLYRNQLIAKATYHFLEKRSYNIIRIGWSTKQADIYHEVIDETIKPNKERTTTRGNKQTDKEIAKKVAAKYINELIQKYVRARIKEGRWPNQCSDVDKYIFGRDIATCIDEPGTAQLFKRLYARTIQVVLNILKEQGNRVQFSNCDKDKLAYANYLRFLNEDEFGFLLPFKYNDSKLHDKYIKCKVTNGNVFCVSVECIYISAFDDDDDTYQRKTEIVSNEEVEIMQKRIE